MSRITGNAISGQTSQRPSNRNDKCHTRLTDSPRSTTVTKTLENRSWWGYSWAGSYPILDIRDVHYRMSKSRHLKLRPNMASWFRTQWSEVASPYLYDRCLSSANLIIADSWPLLYCWFREQPTPSHVLEGESSLLGRLNSWRLLARLYIDESSILPLSYRPPARKMDKIPVKKKWEEMAFCEKKINQWQNLPRGARDPLSREPPSSD